MTKPIEDIKSSEATKTTEELMKNLFIVISKKNTSELLRDYMQGIYKEKDMIERKVDKILKGQIILKTLTESELGVWCVYLYDFISNNLVSNEPITDESRLKERALNESINPKYYYPEFAIEKIKQYYDVNSKKTKTDRMVFHNVIKVKNQFLCPFASNYDINLGMSNGFLGYDTATQRDPDIINVNGMLLKQPNINWNSVKEISEIIYNDSFTANLLSLNILKTSNFNQEGIIYNEKEKTLTITKPVFITDGFHRILAITDAVSRANENGKVLEYGFMISFTNFTIREAQNYVGREDKRNPIDRTYIETLAKNDYNVFIDAINESGEMKNKIANTLNEIGDNTKYTTYGILNTALKIAELDLSISSRNDDYLEVFSTVFDTVIGEYLKKYDYTEIDKLVKENITLNHNVFVGYVAIANELLGRDKKEVRRIIKDMIRNNELNLNKNSGDWKEMEMFKANPKSYRVIFDYFKNITINNLKKGEE